MPYGWREAHFGKGGVSHKTMTRDAYKQLAAESARKLTGSIITALDSWARANVLIDDEALGYRKL